jgi:aminopeptidase N
VSSRRLPAAVLLAAAVVAGAGCQDSPVSGHPATRASLPAGGPTVPTGPTLPALSTPTPSPALPRPGGLDSGRSHPVADPVYPSHGNPALDVLHYGLRLHWDPTTRELSGAAALDIRTTKPVHALRLDFGSPLVAQQVKVDGHPEPSSHPGQKLLVRTGRLARGQRLHLLVRYHGVPKPVPAPTTRQDVSTVGFTAERDGSAWTMQEPFGAFTWYPANDQPSDKALYDIAVTVPEGWTGVANGELVGRTQRPASTTFHWRSRYPMSTYLVTLAIGRYRYASATGPHGLPVSYWVLPGDEAFLNAARQTPQLIAWLEKRLGPYPFESVGGIGVHSGSGMETQTLVTVSPHVDAEVLLHEYAHQWYGDSVTPRTWADLWLNEGFAYYLQTRWYIDHGGASQAAVVAKLATADQRMRARYGPPGRYDPRQFASANVYYCAALMLYRLRHRLGAQLFDRLLRQWPQEHRYQSVDRQEYVRWLDRKTGRHLDRFVHRWLTSRRSPLR